MVIDSLKKEENSYVYNSYTEIYKSIKFVVSELLQDYLKSLDKFKTKDILKGQISETITIDRRVYSSLKNSYTQLSTLLVYYEKILFDLLNKLVIDLSKIIIKNQESVQLYEQITNKYQNNMCNLNMIMMEFFEIFDKFRKIKPLEITNSSVSMGSIIEKDNLFKFFKHVSRRKLISAEDEAKRIEFLEEEVKILKKESKAKQELNQSLLNKIDELKMKNLIIEKSMIDYQKNAEKAYVQELENHVVTFNILKVLTYFILELLRRRNKHGQEHDKWLK